MLSLAAGIFKGLELMKATTIVFAAPKGSQAEIGQAKFEELFPISAARVPILLVLERLDGLPFGDGANQTNKNLQDIKNINTDEVIRTTNSSITKYLLNNPDAQYLFPPAAAPFVEFVSSFLCRRFPLDMKYITRFLFGLVFLHIFSVSVNVLLIVLDMCRI